EVGRVPQEDPGTDFSRLRPIFSDGKQRSMCQLVAVGSRPFPALSALFATWPNRHGAFKVLAPPVPCLALVPKTHRVAFQRLDKDSVPGHVRAEFRRFGQSATNDRLLFTLFTLVPRLLSVHPTQAGRLLIVIPSSFDYVRARQMVSSASIYYKKWAGLSEENSKGDTTRARQFLLDGRLDICLMTERFHYFKRYTLRGASAVIFLAPPFTPSFFAEIGGMGGVEGMGRPSVLCVYDKSDIEGLVRLVGAPLTQKLISPSAAKVTVVK
ncbi:digestive organ expansion factor, predicted, partial [Kipferlia bialata]